MTSSAPPDHGRRGFLRGTATRRPMRPPWALAEAAFVDRCTRCMACAEHCPEQILVRGSGGFPELDTALGGCTFCADCVTACEPLALDRAAGDVPWHWRAAIDTMCLASRGVVCESCRDACDAGALRFPLIGRPAAPALDAERCTGCGACVAGCPAGAITLVQITEAVPA
jgi:ferredoxin-type protein NapF